MRSKLVLVGILAILGLLALVGCSKSTKSQEDESSSIRGRVVDASGGGISNAAIMLTYNFQNAGSSPAAAGDGNSPRVQHLLRPNRPHPSTDIAFTLPEQCHVKLWITDYCRSDTVKVLIDEVMLGGSFTVNWDGKNEEGDLVLNGVYYYCLHAGEWQAENSMVLSYSYSGYDSPQGLQSHAATGSDGYFEISQDCLPFGHESAKYDDQGNQIGIVVITREVGVWVLHDSYSTASEESVWVDSRTGAYVTIQLTD
ncbi:MAG: carboxypeptidase-like regulatory domain-containing protein [Candidatus Zixiibacteriota bacterium]